VVTAYKSLSHVERDFRHRRPRITPHPPPTHRPGLQQQGVSPTQSPV